MHISLELPTGAHLVLSDGREQPIPLTLRFTLSDPHAVHVDFPAHVSADDEKVTWTFARALLEEGLAAPVRQGGVRIWPGGAHSTLVELHGSEGVAMIRFDSTVLRRFVNRSRTVVTSAGLQPCPGE